MIERSYEEFTGRLEQILGRFVPSKLKDLTPEGAMDALKSMEGEQGFMIINIFDHQCGPADGRPAPQGQVVPDRQSARGDPNNSL